MHPYITLCTLYNPMHHTISGFITIGWIIDIKLTAALFFHNHEPFLLSNTYFTSVFFVLWFGWYLKDISNPCKMIHGWLRKINPLWPSSVNTVTTCSITCEVVMTLVLGSGLLLLPLLFTEISLRPDSSSLGAGGLSMLSHSLQLTFTFHLDPVRLFLKKFETESLLKHQPWDFCVFLSDLFRSTFSLFGTFVNLYVWLVSSY